MSGRMYSAVFEEVAVTAVQDLFTLIASSSTVIAVHGIWISQSSDAGDAASEQLNILIHRGSTTGSGGSALTARPLHNGLAAFSGTIRANDTTQGTEGNQIFADSFNVMAGWQWIPTPEMRPHIPPSGRLTVELQTAPADSLTMSGTIIFEVLG